MSIDYCTVIVPNNIPCRDFAVAYNAAMCRGDTAAALAANKTYVTCLAGNSSNSSNTLASFSQQFPDIPFDGTTFSQAVNNYVTANGNLSTVIVFQTNLRNQIEALKLYQSTLIASTPEYIDQSASPTFLSNVNTVNIQGAALQNQLSIIGKNLQNSQLKLNGNMSAVLFYIYTTATIILGILCIILIVYLVYMYVTPSGSIVSNVSNSIKQNPV